MSHSFHHSRLPLVATTLDKTEAVLTQYYAGNVEAYQKKLEQTTLDNLQFISSSLSTSRLAEPVLQDDRLEEIRTEISSLFDNIQDSDIDDREKAHLLNLLDLLAHAVVEVDVGGASALYSAANEVVGTMITEYPTAGVSHWRQVVATFALGIAVNISSGLVEDHALPASEQWAQGVAEYFEDFKRLDLPEGVIINVDDTSGTDDESE